MKKILKYTFKSILCASFLMALPLYTVSPVLAAETRTQQTRDLHTTSKITTTKDQPLGLRTNRTLVEPTLRIISVRVFSRDGKLLDAKLATSTVKKLNKAISACTAMGTGWDCFVECLGDFGVSPVQMVLCAATCVVGGPILCAICVGVTVTVIEFCGVGCAFYAN